MSTHKKWGLNLDDGSDQLERLVNHVYVHATNLPTNLSKLKCSLYDLFEYLVSPNGRTEYNVCRVDSFFCLQDCWRRNLKHLPSEYQSILEDVGTSLHDSISSSQIAENFESTPEQLLARIENLAPSVSGTILEHSQKMPFFTDLRKVFEAIDRCELKYDWLVTELECDWYPKEFLPLIKHDHVGIVFTGRELSEIVFGSSQPIQFIWAVLTGFLNGTAPPPNDSTTIPYADGNEELFNGSPTIQYPGAVVELVCFDSSLFLMNTSESHLAKSFRKFFPESVDEKDRIAKIRRNV